MFHHNLTSADAVIALHWTQVDDFLTALHIALNDPIERAAAKYFRLALRKHAGDVILLDRQTMRPLARRILIAPFDEIFNRVAADAEFENVESHKTDVEQPKYRINRFAVFCLRV